MFKELMLKAIGSYRLGYSQAVKKEKKKKAVCKSTFLFICSKNKSTVTNLWIKQGLHPILTYVTSQNHYVYMSVNIQM